MDGSHEHIEQKKPGTKVYLLYDSIYMNFKNRQNQTIIIEVRREVTSLFPFCVNRQVVLIGRRGLSGVIEMFFL